MYGNKKYRNIVCWILIFALAFVPVRRANAVAPAIPAAVYYAIAATGTACGIYAMNKDSLDYMVADYWNSCGEYIQRQWQWLGEYGYMVGKMTIDGALTKTVIDYLNENYVAGENVIPTVDSPYIPGKEYNSLGDVRIRVGYSLSSGWRASVYRISTGDRICTVDTLPQGIQTPEDAWPWANQCVLWVADGYVYAKALWSGKTVRVGDAVSLVGNGDGIIANGSTLTGDSAGFGSALAPEQEVKVPCPPVPPAEWPDRWIDDLERDLNNTTADRYVETMDDEFDWYIDKDGHIYKKPKGEPPKEDDDTKLVPPVPLPFDPIHPQPGEPGPATPDLPWIPADPCPYCPPQPGPAPDCPNPYCPNHPQPQTPPQYNPNSPPEPCPYCPPNPDPGLDPCPNPYCPNNPAPQTPPLPKPQPGQPGGPPIPDDRYIDFEPLKKLPHIFTTKFPFSLPWDLKRGIESLEGGQWDRKFRIAACGNYWPEMEIDISMFDPIAGIARVVFLLVFDFGLIFATRRLMGGDV